MSSRLRLVGAERLDVTRGFHERVVGDPRHRGMPAPAVDTKREGRRHLLRSGAQVHRCPAEHQPLASALVDRVVAARGLRVGLDEPAKPVALVPANSADLLVGHHDQHQVAGRDEALPFQRRERDGRRRDLALHVERSPPPHLAVDEVARPRVAVPLGGIGEHGVRVGEEREGRTVAARDPRDEVRAMRLQSIELALDSILREVVAQQLRGDRLVPRRVHRVEPEKPLQELCRLFAQRRDGLGDRINSVPRSESRLSTARSARSGPPRARGTTSSTRAGRAARRESPGSRRPCRR